MTILSSVKLPVNYLKEIQIFDKALFFIFLLLTISEMQRWNEKGRVDRASHCFHIIIITVYTIYYTNYYRLKL